MAIIASFLRSARMEKKKNIKEEKLKIAEKNVCACMNYKFHNA